ncbi:glutamine-hydrolyzing carbamoyl-phosphate synthase small subunit [Acidiferrimicrobium sp. IK]|uniref:glutamine-hydrolyzing carbamoyl-phosphate synthase small subunit n=1 Tax=Acidiferrimicrobium sp. IK TaxID=2871700 RepID=UPI0021CB1522|nr:glutamine-hydrolyzing carbamoyl-phosphate synthase small subunit [Acidiferrimicrobium sp. IK]
MSSPEPTSPEPRSPRPGRRPKALLVFGDGTTFEGEAMGAATTGGVAAGEVVFNTVLSGYQEVITDPSYAGQILTFTYPHIGNYGVNAADAESAAPACRGVVIRALTDRPSNWRSEEGLEAYLTRHGVAGITGVDTRRLTRYLRDAGARPAALGAVEGDGATDEATLRARASAEKGTDGVDLVATVSTAKPYTYGDGPYRVVAYDFGIKRTMLELMGRMATIEVVPASTPAAAVLDRKPDGVFLSNGPGDPAALPYAVDAIKGLLGEVPVFGICLGHQLLGEALGAGTFKLPFGHHGGNHPVRRLAGGPVEITSQNHNYAVSAEGLEGAEVTHVNLNDGVVEGLASGEVPAFSVQYHPEAGPGPHDARYLFEEFRILMETGRPPLGRLHNRERSA